MSTWVEKDASWPLCGQAVKDRPGAMGAQGENTRSAMRACSASVGQIVDCEPLLRDFAR